MLLPVDPCLHTQFVEQLTPFLIGHLQEPCGCLILTHDEVCEQALLVAACGMLLRQLRVFCLQSAHLFQRALRFLIEVIGFVVVLRL